MMEGWKDGRMEGMEGWKGGMMEEWVFQPLNP